MSNILAILIGFIFGVGGGFWASDLFKWVNLRLRSFIAGGIGGVVGLLASFQFEFPALIDDWHAIPNGSSVRLRGPSGCCSAALAVGLTLFMP